MPIDIEIFTMIQCHKKTGIKPNVVANTVILARPFSKHEHKVCTKFIGIVLSPESGIQDCSQILGAFLKGKDIRFPLA